MLVKAYSNKRETVDVELIETLPSESLFTRAPLMFKTGDVIEHTMTYPGGEVITIRERLNRPIMIYGYRVVK